MEMGKNILLYSYGSGSMASLYRMHLHDFPVLGTDLNNMLDKRVQHTPSDYLNTIQRYSDMYGKFDVNCPQLKTLYTENNVTWALKSVDALGKRRYERVSF